MPELGERTARVRLLPGLFWAGVGLAPVAGLLLLLGSGGALRAGGFLALVALLLVGLSAALRPDAAAVRQQVEESLLTELDRLRSDVRNELATTSRASHQTFGERLGALQHVVESLRAERVAGYAVPRSAAPAPGPRPAAGVAAAPSGPAAARHPAAGAAAAVPVAPGPAVGGPGAPAGDRRVPVEDGYAPVGDGRAARFEPPPTGRAAAPGPGGVYRHTETVQVTRSTSYVDDSTGNVDHSGYGGHSAGPADRDWSGSPPLRGRAAEAYEESWTDQKLRERYGRRPRPYDRAGGEPASAAPWGDGGPQSWRPVSVEPQPGRPVSARPVSAEPVRRVPRRRWGGEDASGEMPAVGEVLAAGESRQGGASRAARHRDDDRGELRYPDRWAVAGEDQPGAGGGPTPHRPALPAASSEPSWNEDWREVESWREAEPPPEPPREPVGRRGTEGWRGNQDWREPEGRRGNPEHREPEGRREHQGRRAPERSPEPEDWNQSWNEWWGAEQPPERRGGHRYRPDFALSDERWR